MVLNMIRMAILFAALTTGLDEPKVDPLVLIKRYEMECIEETRVNSDSIIKILNRKWSLPKHQEPLVKEWALCVLMKSGVMTKEGVYKIDVALNRVPEAERDTVEKLIDKCLDTNPIPAQDIAYKYIKCFQKNKSNHTVHVSVV